MKANPGGQLAPSDVIGRDPLIARLWDILQRQSVVLTSERRIGKTQMVKKMEAEAPETVLAIYRDLENIGSVLAFVEAVFTDVEEYLRQRNRLANRVRQSLHHFSGVEVGE